MTRWELLTQRMEMRREQGLMSNVGTREQLFTEVARIQEIRDNMSIEEAGLEV